MSVPLFIFSRAAGLGREEAGVPRWTEPTVNRAWLEAAHRTVHKAKEVRGSEGVSASTAWRVRPGREEVKLMGS